MEELAPPAQTRVAKALSHPLRHRLLIAYADREATPADVARQLEVPLTTVSYHTQRLLQSGLIAPVRTERRRGGLAHYYRSVSRPQFEDEVWASIPDAARHSLIADVLSAIWEDTGSALGRGAFDAADVHVSRVPLELDGPAHEELSAILRRVVDDAQRLQRETEARAEQPRRQTTLAILHFDRES
jgi:DNA-binding transcriptional ArsR family regulator